ncbi:response regulator [Roseivivax lentus]|nr:response regulator transcription factor [Roseivivax lentus]
MTAHTILVVDDDAGVRTLLRDVFESGGFAVLEAADGAAALAALERGGVRLVTLDLQLGSRDGLDVASEIRQRSDVPIVMVTGRDDVVDRVVGLELGADDYITKPFHVREVLARVRSVLRRAGQPEAPADAASGTMPGPVDGAESAPAFGFDGLKAIPDRFELIDRDGTRCDLTSGDFKLLSAFLQNAGRVMSRDRLMDLIGGVSWSPYDRTVDNQVARLRKKIERDPADPQIIKTVRGVGYSFAAEVTRLQPDAGSSAAASRRANAP